MTQPAHPAPIEIPERIGRYRIVRPLSKGGMALVYEARRESLAGVSPRVAVKVIIPDYASSDQFQELFINEARLGAQLHHQNLVQIQDFDRDGDKFFLVMEYVEGLTFRRIISQCARSDLLIPLDVICEMGRQACDGLNYAHAANDEQGRHLGLVHRDMKPSNIVLNPQGVVKILDFGISKGRLIREKKGAVKGTWGYMAPEQAAGHEVGPAADVFGLATVLYELAARRSLFEARAPEEIKRLLDDDHAVRMASQLDPAYGQLVPVLMRALQRDASARYATAGDFGRALSELMQSPITARDELKRFFEYVEAIDRGKIPPGRAPGTGSGIGDSPQGSAAVSQASLVASHQSGPPAEGGYGSILWALAIAAGAGLMMVVMILAGGLGVAWISQPEGAGDVPSEVLTPKPAADEPPGPAAAGVPDAPPPAALRTEPAAKRPPPETAVPSTSVRTTEKAPVAKAPDEATIIVRRVSDPAPTAAKVEPTAVPVVQDPVPPVDVGTGRMTISATPGTFEIYVDGKLVNKGPISRAEFPAGKHLVAITLEDGRTKSFEVTLAADQEMRKIWDFERMEWRR